MKKAQGESAIRLILLSIFVILLIGFFLRNAALYIRASHEATAQDQLSKMNFLIQAYFIENNNSYFVHTHSDIFMPYEGNSRKGIKPSKQTLAQLFLENDFTPAKPGKTNCYLYVYWPAEISRENLDKDKNLYLISTWGVQTNTVLTAGSLELQKWAQKNLKENHFECDISKMTPRRKAISLDGSSINIPGFNFQFVEDQYTKSY